MKNFLKLILILTSSSFFGQQTNEELFKKDLDFLINDAQNGFPQTIGAFIKREYGSNYYQINKTLLDLPSKFSGLAYSEERQSKYDKKIFPELFYYYQNIPSDTPKGIYVYENFANIVKQCDSIADLKGWKKKASKQKDKSNIDRYIAYEYKKKKTALTLSLDSEKKKVSINIFSDLRPQSTGPKLLGCLVLYNIQLSQYVSAATYYVYGESLASAGDLYNKILSGQSETFQRVYSKYEWMPYANAQQVDKKMKSLNIKEDSHKIDTNGYSIN